MLAGFIKMSYPHPPLLFSPHSSHDNALFLTLLLRLITGTYQFLDCTSCHLDAMTGAVQRAILFFKIIKGEYWLSVYTAKKQHLLVIHPHRLSSAKHGGMAEYFIRYNQINCTNRSAAGLTISLFRMMYLYAHQTLLLTHLYNSTLVADKPGAVACFVS